MKLFIIGLLISLSALADKKKEKPQPITIRGLRELAKVDPNSGRVEYLEGARPDEVVRTLIQGSLQCQQQLQECQNPKNQKKEKKK